jgi:hypothetical protein
MDEVRIIIKWKQDQGAWGPSLQEVAAALRDISMALDHGRCSGDSGGYTWRYDEG